MADMTGTLGGLPIGLLASMFLQQQQPQQVDPNEQASQLAAKMRLQSPDVPAPDQQPGLSDQLSDTFDERFGMLNAPSQSSPPSVPLPQPRPNVAPQGNGNGLDAMAAIPPMSPNQGVVPQAPMARPMPQQAAPQASAGPGGLTNFLANLGASVRSAGLIGGIAQAAQGGLTGAQNQTVQALVNRGVAPDMAQIMARDPEVLNQMLPLMMGIRPKQFTTIGHDAYGQPTYGFVDPYSSKVYDLSGNEVKGGSVLGQGIPGLDANGNQITGQAYLDSLKGTQYEAKIPIIQGIASGKLPYPSGAYLKTPAGQWLQTAISSYKPGFNAQTYQQVQKGYNDWYGGGKDQGIVKSMRQASSHAVDLINSVDKLGNYPGGALVNAPLNAIGSYVGKTGYNPVVTNAHALADELAGIWRTAGMSDTEIKAWGDAFRANGSPAQQKEDVAKLLQLYQGGINALEDKRQDTFGQDAAHLPPVVNPSMQENLDKVKAWSEGTNAAKGAAVAPTQPTQGVSTDAPISNNDALALARSMIAKGADRNQVIMRLQQRGVNTSGL